MQIKISFQGGSGNYIALEKRSRFFEETYGNILGNYSITQMDIADLIHVGTLSWRCDLLIITPVVFEEHVRQLARWKEEKGIITRVATLEDIAAAQGGTTADDIRDYIQNVYNSTNLSYVLLVGDVEFIPVHYRSIHPTHNVPIGTDLFYAEMDDEGYFPDLGIGRLSVDTAPQAELVISKIIDYEKNPPSDHDFYERILHISHFEDWNSITEGPFISDGYDESSFLKRIEEIRDYFLFLGDYPYLPRQYATDKGSWPTDDEDFAGPQWYYDGTPVPDYLRWPGFAWDGDASGIISELEAGAFLAIYIAHGKSFYWWNPRFPGHAPGQALTDLNNGNLTPLILSFACRTGWFDHETDTDSPDETFPNEESLAEKFLRMDGGAVAFVGASRNSRGRVNEEMAQAFIDGIWDSMIHGYPSAEWPPPSYELSTRLGDVLNYAKFYVAQEHGRPDNPDQDFGISQVMFEVFHLHGDPTMELWVSDPEPLIDLPPHRKIPMRPLGEEWLEFEVPLEIDGVVATLMRKDEILGQGISSGGRAVIQMEEPLTNAQRRMVSLSKQGYITRAWPVSLSTPPAFGLKSK
jgi:hypothetical protein